MYYICLSLIIYAWLSALTVCLNTHHLTTSPTSLWQDDWADSYDASLVSWGYPAPRRMAETLAAHGVPSTAAILDLGCGTGMSGEALRAHDPSFSGTLTGVDISQKSLDLVAATKPGL